MTNRTRRRLFICLVIAALTLPAELVLLKAVTADQATASAQWVERLPEANLAAAAKEIQNYPFQYRKDIMKRLSADQRRAVWVDHIATYRDGRPELSAEQVDALNAAIAAAEATFANPGDDARAATRLVAERVQELFGADVAEYLMYRLGNKTTLMLVNALPWYQRMADTVRERFVVQAGAAGDCWCNVDFGCDLGALTYCEGAVSCTVDNDWPACGWFWDETCNGGCRIGIVT